MLPVDARHGRAGGRAGRDREGTVRRHRCAASRRAGALPVLLLRVLRVLRAWWLSGEGAEVQVRQARAVLAAGVEAVLLTPALGARSRR